MKTIALNKQISAMSLSNDSLFIDESDGIFDDNWLVSANDLFGNFAMNTDESDLTTYYNQAA